MFGKNRRIKTGLFLINGVCYRIYVIIFQTILWFVFNGLIHSNWILSVAVNTSLIYNIFSTILYYTWHYFFLKKFKIGKNGE